MSIIRELLELHKQAEPKPIMENRYWFDENETLTFDPDRDDPADIAHKLMPVIVKMAYVRLQEDKAKHEKHSPADDPEATPFDFTREALHDAMDDLLKALHDRFNDKRYERDADFWIDQVEKHFKQPLQPKPAK